MAHSYPAMGVEGEGLRRRCKHCLEEHYDEIQTQFFVFFSNSIGDSLYGKYIAQIKKSNLLPKPRFRELEMSSAKKADVNKLDNPAWPKANHRVRTELCV